MSKSVILSNHLILCHPLLLLSLVFPSIRGFSSGLALHIRWPKYWSITFSISSSNIYSGLISFRTGLILQSKGLSRVFSCTTIQKHHFLSAQPSLWSNSHPSMTTRKNIVLTIWTFVGKMMSLLFNTLSEFVIAFLPKSTCLLILWLKSLSIVIVETKKIKSVPCFHVFPFACHEGMGPDAMILVF